MNKGRVIRTQSPCRRGAYPHQQERVKAKLALSFTIPPLFQHRSGMFMGPNASNTWWGSGHAAKWPQDPLRCVLRNRSRKEKKQEKFKYWSWGSCRWLLWSLWFGVLSQVAMKTPAAGKGDWNPGHGLVGSLEFSTHSASSPGKEAAEPQAEHAAWCSQTFLHVADQPVSYHGGRDGWKLLSNSKSKKKTGMRTGKGKAWCKQQDRGMLRE